MADNNNSNVSGWAAWVGFIGILLVLAGFFQALAGLLALFNSSVLVYDAGSLVLFNLMTWGWIHLVIGILLAIAGFSIIRGHTFGRVFGVVLACVSLVGNLAFIGAAPFWSVVVIALDVLVIYGLVTHGGELRDRT